MPEDKPKSNRGGYRPGSGRKPASEEMKSRELAQKAIIEKYGTIVEGMKKLLETGEPSLVKFVWEHAQGKPTDKIDMTTRVEETRIVDINDDGTEDEDSDEYEDGKDYDYITGETLDAQIEPEDEDE